MGLRGPRKLTSSELKKKGSRRDVIKARQRQEAKRAPVTMLRPSADAVAVPEGMTHPTAVAYWQKTLAELTFDAQALAIFTQAVHSLEVAERCREEVLTQGRTCVDNAGRRTLHPCAKLELEHRRLFASLCKDLGFLSTE